jgi:hypothetical protein
MTMTDLPPIIKQRGGDPSVLADELLHIISWAATQHPRSQQVAIGPSEIGCECPRRLAYKLAGVESVNSGGSGWRPTVGTAVHSWLQHAFELSNLKLGEVRWLTETRVDVGEIDGEAVTGSCDVYDRITAVSTD